MGGSAAFGLDRIGQIAVPVSDIDRAIRFYRDVLGMRFLFQAPPGLGFFDFLERIWLITIDLSKQHC